MNLIRSFWLSLSRTVLVGSAAGGLALVLPACSPDDDSNKKSKDSAEVCQIEPTLDISVCEPAVANFPQPTTISNAFFPLGVGTLLTLEGEEDGESISLAIEVMDESEMVGEITTRVVNETAMVNGELEEFAVNYFAQSVSGDVCYFGETVDNYVDGEIDNHDGSWRADEDDNQPGIIMPAAPAVGDAYQQEVATGVAEDLAEVVALDEVLVTPYGTLTDTVTTDECNPLTSDPYETKLYASGIGIAYDNGLELTAVAP